MGDILRVLVAMFYDLGTITIKAVLGCGFLVWLVMLGDALSSAVGGSNEGWAKPPEEKR